MSSDNFYVVKGNKVWMGFASDHEAAMSHADEEWYKALMRRRPIFVGDDAEAAATWAHAEYAEYGVWPLPDALKSGEGSST